MATDLTVRERILAQMYKNLDALSDGSSAVFERTSRASLSTENFSGDCAASLLDEGEQVAVYEVGYLQIDMLVTVEFYVRIEEGAVQSTELNRLAGLITKEFLSKINVVEDVTNDSLALNVRMGSLQFDIDGPSDGYVFGARQFIVTYRHDKQDPYTLR